MPSFKKCNLLTPVKHIVILGLLQLCFNIIHYLSLGPVYDALEKYDFFKDIEDDVLFPTIDDAVLIASGFTSQNVKDTEI